jgi:TonB family protein
MKATLLAALTLMLCTVCSAQVALFPRHVVAPTYPQIAKTAHITGKVLLLVTIEADGRVSSVEVTSGPPLLQRNAVENVKLWVFDRPAAAPFIQSVVYSFQFGDEAFQKSCKEGEVRVNYDFPEWVNLLACLPVIDVQSNSASRSH